jgi:hypothetical protein
VTLDTKELCGRNDMRRGYNQATASGLPFWSLDPQPEDIRITDIAAQLARICRYNGALRDDVEIYSVAQHCVLVSRHVPKGFKLEGLLHDAAEAYVGDRIKPIKDAVPDFQRLEDSIDRVIRAKFGLPPTKSPEVKNADYRAALTERRDVYPRDHKVDWGVARAEPWRAIIKPWGVFKARREFLKRFVQLTGGVENV